MREEMIDRISEILDRKIRIYKESHERPTFSELWKINKLASTVDFLLPIGNNDELLEKRLQIIHGLLDVGDILVDKEVRDFLEKEKIGIEKILMERKPATSFAVRPKKHVRKLSIDL